MCAVNPRVEAVAFSLVADALRKIVLRVLEHDAIRQNRARGEFGRRLTGWVRDIDETIVSFAYRDEFIFDQGIALDRATDAKHAAGARRRPQLFDNAVAGLRFPT